MDHNVRFGVSKLPSQAMDIDVDGIRVRLPVQSEHLILNMGALHNSPHLAHQQFKDKCLALANRNDLACNVNLSMFHIEENIARAQHVAHEFPWATQKGLSLFGGVGARRLQERRLKGQIHGGVAQGVGQILGESRFRWA